MIHPIPLTVDLKLKLLSLFYRPSDHTGSLSGSCMVTRWIKYMKLATAIVHSTGKWGGTYTTNCFIKYQTDNFTVWWEFETYSPWNGKHAAVVRLDTKKFPFHYISTLYAHSFCDERNAAGFKAVITPFHHLKHSPSMHTNAVTFQKSLT